MLTDLAGTILEKYSFDAYGNALGFSAAAALTSYLHSGEHFDSRIGQQYLRARWYDATTGRFNRLDPFFGNLSDPQSLHKYLYVHGDPVNLVDPTGKFGLVGMSIGMSMASGLREMKIGVDMAVFDAVSNTVLAVQMGRPEQVFQMFMYNELKGFGIGFLGGKVLGVFGAVWENGIGHGANRAAIKQFFRNGWEDASQVFRRLGFWPGKPNLPAPKQANRLPGAMATSQRWQAVEASETQLAFYAHTIPDHQVIAWGWRPNAGGPDVISVNSRTGEVVLWDAKWSGSTQTSLAFSLSGQKKTRWIGIAEREIKNSDLPKGVKQQALNQLTNRKFKAIGVGYGTLAGKQKVI